MFAKWLPKGSMRQLVATNTVSQLVGRLISTGAMTVMSLLLARQFGSVGYGDFVKITTFVGFFYLFADFGLNAAYVQGSIESLDRESTISWQRLFGLRIVMSILLMGLLYGILSLFPQTVGQGYTELVRLGIILLSPAIIVQATITTTNALFQKLLRYDLATGAQNIGSIFMLLLAFALVYTSATHGPMIGVLALFAGSLGTAIAALYYVQKIHGKIFPIFNRLQMLRDVQATLPLGLTLIFNLIYFHSDSVILTLTRSTAEVGIYGLAYKVFELPLVVPIFFMNAVYPLLLKSRQNDLQSSEKIFWLSLKVLVIGSVIIGIGLWMLAPLFVYIRPEFVMSILALRVLLLGLPVFFVSALLMWILISQKQQWNLLKVYTAAMIFNMGLNIVYIPRYGYVAAAWITGISELFICILSFALVIRKFRRERNTL